MGGRSLCNSSDDIVVTGMGAVSALGVGCATMWRAVSEGRGGIRPIERFAIDGLEPQVGGIVPGTNGGSDETLRTLGFSFAENAAREALDEARLLDTEGSKMALVIGASVGLEGEPPHTLAEQLGESLGIAGPRVTISTACTSSTHAIGLGADLLRRGEADAVLAGGADTLGPALLAGFYTLGVVARGPCAPFSQPVGMTLGEGAGFLVLERRCRALERGCAPKATILGYGLSGDAYHLTSPHPRGSGVACALQCALVEADLSPERVEYINAHGTGTEMNDPAEWCAFREVFGERAGNELAVSSSKGHLGHAQAAAGVLEVIVTLLAMERGVVPPTASFSSPRRHGPPDPVGSLRPRSHVVSHAVSTNSGFGGVNCAVVLGSPVVERPAFRERPSQELFIVGAGALSAHGAVNEVLLESIEKGEPLDFAPLDADLLRLPRGADPRGLDPAAIFLTHTAALALEDAELAIRGPLRERTGLVVGTTSPSPSSIGKFQRSIERRGLAKASTSAFARSVPNASQGSCAMLLSIKGPQTTVSVGRGSGLFAIVCAADMLSSRRDADLLVAGGVDELDRESESSPDWCEGAACVVLARGGDEALERAQKVNALALKIVGHSIGGPGLDQEETVERALSRAGLTRSSVDAFFRSGLDLNDQHSLCSFDPDRALGHPPGWSSAAACVAACAWLRQNPSAIAVVAGTNDGTTSSALVLRNVLGIEGEGHA